VHSNPVRPQADLTHLPPVTPGETSLLKAFEVPLSLVISDSDGGWRKAMVTDRLVVGPKPHQEFAVTRRP
jgi:hypothetical protein